MLHRICLPHQLADVLGEIGAALHHCYKNTGDIPFRRWRDFFTQFASFRKSEWRWAACSFSLTTRTIKKTQKGTLFQKSLLVGYPLRFLFAVSDQKLGGARLLTNFHFSATKKGDTLPTISQERVALYIKRVFVFSQRSSRRLYFRRG